MDVNEMTRLDFDALPLQRWDEEVGLFDWIVILPMNTIHDSDFRCMDFVGGIGDKAVVRLSGCWDVLHLGGITGMNDKEWRDKPAAIRGLTKPVPWQMDCLKASGYQRLFVYDHKIKVGEALSSFDVYAIPDRDKP